MNSEIKSHSRSTVEQARNCGIKSPDGFGPSSFIGVGHILLLIYIPAVVVVLGCESKVFLCVPVRSVEDKSAIVIVHNTTLASKLEERNSRSRAHHLTVPVTSHRGMSRRHRIGMSTYSIST